MAGIIPDSIGVVVSLDADTKKYMTDAIVLSAGLVFIVFALLHIFRKV